MHHILRSGETQAQLQSQSLAQSLAQPHRNARGAHQTTILNGRFVSHFVEIRDGSAKGIEIICKLTTFSSRSQSTAPFAIAYITFRFGFKHNQNSLQNTNHFHRFNDVHKVFFGEL